MFETVAAIIVAISLVLPGFIIADLAEARRAQPQARSDWELVLRALIYALVLQSAVLLTGWTTRLIDTAGLLRHAAHGMRPTWESHIGAIALWVLVVILIVPTVLGLLLGWFLRRAERHGDLTWFHYALGGRDARDAWDYIFLRYGSGFVLIHRKGASDPAGRYLVGKFGRASGPRRLPPLPATSTSRKCGLRPPTGRSLTSLPSAAACGCTPATSRRSSSSSLPTRPSPGTSARGHASARCAPTATKTPRWATRITVMPSRDPSIIKEGGYQGSSDPGRPTSLMQQQTRPAPQPAAPTSAPPANSENGNG